MAELRVWHGPAVDLAGAEVPSAVAWVHHDPILDAIGGTMLVLTDAADQAGVAYRTRELGLRARWTRIKPDKGQAFCELPLWPR